MNSNNNNNNQSEILTLGSIPSMPSPKSNIEYTMKWWIGKSISAVEDKGGSFNLNLYLAFLRCRNSELLTNE